MIKFRSNSTVLVVGDLMLDLYKYGNATRISPEAPVPVILVDRTEMHVGGAANVAANTATFGLKTYVCGFVGEDDYGNIIKNKLSDLSCNTELILSTGFTINKTRVIANGQHIVRYDFDGQFNDIVNNKNLLAKYIEALLKSNQIDVVLISDYDKQTLDENIINTIKSNVNCPVICDIKPKNAFMFSNVYCVTPNVSEAMQIAGVHSYSSYLELCRAVKDKMNVQCVLLTLSEHGICILDEEMRFYHYPAWRSSKSGPSTRLDVTGAGDTVLAAFAMAIANNSSFAAAEIANVAASIVVNKSGTATCHLNELESELCLYHAQNNSTSKI